jgi:hypothetical protein
MGTSWAQSESDTIRQEREADELKILSEIGGRQEDRTPDLRIANAALSQLS